MICDTVYSKSSEAIQLAENLAVICVIGFKVHGASWSIVTDIKTGTMLLGASFFNV